VNWRRALQLFLVALPIFCIDYITKALVDFYIQPMHYAASVFPYGGVPIFHNFFGIDFCLNHVANRGAAWGIFSKMQEPLLILRIVVIIGLAIYMARSAKAALYHTPLTLILTGAISNVVDYFIYGHVIDMFHFIFWGYSYPVFNVADAAIFCGIAWIFLHSFSMKKRHVPSTL
jgi:signal peptidase II